MVISESFSRRELYPNVQLKPDRGKWVKAGYLYSQCKSELECIIVDICDLRYG